MTADEIRARLRRIKVLYRRLFASHSDRQVILGRMVWLEDLYAELREIMAG